MSGNELAISCACHFNSFHVISTHFCLTKRLCVAMESKASFAERAKEVGIDEALLSRLVTAGLDTFNKLAYICAANPTSGDDAKLKQALEDLLGQEITPINMISFRQLWFEAYTLAMTELEERVKKTPMDTPKSLPLAERMSRIQRQKQKLTGLVLDQFLEPAHSLTDKAHAMIEDGVLVHIPPEKCLSRHDEIQNQKTEQQVTFDSQGNLRISKKAADMSCDTTGELRLRQALTRKALAFDQAGLCSFDRLEQWHTQMMHATMRTPPSGHKFVSMQQVLNADRELWSLLSQESRGTLRVGPGEDPPLDKKIEELRISPQILCFMTPLPAGNNDRPKQPAAPSTGAQQPPKRPANDSNKSFTPRGGDKSKQFKPNAAGGKTVKDLLQSLPPNCVSKTETGKFICLHYNNGTCRKQKNSSCNMGVHMCYYKGCGQKRPYIECSH